MILLYIVHAFLGMFIFFENQHFFPISSVPSSSTVVLPSFEQQFSDLPQVGPCFKPHRVYTRRSHPQSFPVAHPICDPNMHRNQSIAAPPKPLVRRSSRVSVPPDRYEFSFGNSISTLIATLSNFDIPACYSHVVNHDC